jgi:hypothetical protein
MDRETLEKNLTQAEAHVAKGHERIALLHEIIAELEREGHDTVPARELLATFESTQAMHIANRDRIAASWQPSTRLPAMPSETETLALHLVHAPVRCGGRPSAGMAHARGGGRGNH